MKISIVVPSYNQGQFIEETLKSIFNQSYKNYQVIVIDGRSQDKTIKILKRYQKKYPEKLTWISEKDKGQTEAINKGLKLAKGEILTYLNSDDLYEKNTLTEAVDFFKKNPQAKIIYGQGKFINEKGRYLGNYKTQHPDFNSLFKECVISQPTVFFTKEVYEKIGEFDENFNYAMDYDYWIRMVKKYQFYYAEKVIAYTRLHKNSKTSQSEQVFKEILKVLKKNYGKVSDQAIFNYVYVKEKNSLKRILLALKLYFQYKQMPRFFGFKIFLILLKELFFKKRS